MTHCEVMSTVATYDSTDKIDWTASVDDINLQEQRDEVLALQSIYEGSDEERIQVLSEPDKDGRGLYEIEFTVPVQMPTDSCQVDIWIPNDASQQAADDHREVDTDDDKVVEEGARALTPPPTVNRAVTLERSLSGQRWTGSFRVKYLSPLILHVTFPPHYPSEDPPAFTLTCIWLSGTQLSTLCRQLDALWEANKHMPIIFSWVDFLESEALGYSNDKEAVEFCKSAQECCLCFDEKAGTQFFRLLPCKHHFCFDCLAAHCSLHVTDGTIQLLTCPGYECKSIIQPDVLQTVLSPELFARWETLSLQRTLDEMEDIVYCPRCRSVVIREQEATLNLGHCLVCFYSFCPQCEQPWHQRPNTGVPEWAAEIKNRTVKCPKCKVAIEKIAGCNKMTCHCGQSFCWLCQKAINGYSHFRGSSCELFVAALTAVPRVNYRPPPD
ncbi:hypothetical protein BaRGS_00032678, partial [Batillaria attramentaria]